MQTHMEAHRKPSKTAVAKDLSLIVLPISMPAWRFPPSLLNTTTAFVSRPTSVRNLISSPASKRPSTATRACAGSLSNGESKMFAARLEVFSASSVVHTMPCSRQRRITLPALIATTRRLSETSARTALDLLSPVRA